MFDDKRNTKLASTAASRSGDRRSQLERTPSGAGLTSVMVALTTDATYGSVCVLKPSAPSGSVGATPATGSGATATVDTGENSLPNTNVTTHPAGENFSAVSHRGGIHGSLL